MPRPTKYIFVTGGVVSSLGKGLTSASIGMLLERRGLKVRMPSPGSKAGSVALIGNPVKFSKTPVTYYRPPPRCGADTEAVLDELLTKNTLKIV